jgi:hypothetical protein
MRTEIAWEYYSKLCSKNRGQFENEPAMTRLWMKSNFELKVHGSSKSSTSKTRFGGMLFLCKYDRIQSMGKDYTYKDGWMGLRSIPMTLKTVSADFYF